MWTRARGCANGGSAAQSVNGGRERQGVVGRTLYRLSTRSSVTRICVHAMSPQLAVVPRGAPDQGDVPFGCR